MTPADELAAFVDRIMHKTTPAELIIGRIVVLRPFDIKNPIIDLPFIDDETFELRCNDLALITLRAFDGPLGPDLSWKHVRVERCLVTPEGLVYEPWHELTRQLLDRIAYPTGSREYDLKPSQMLKRDAALPLAH